jgi:hypothetical protein
LNDWPLRVTWRVSRTSPTDRCAFSSWIIMFTIASP